MKKNALIIGLLAIFTLNCNSFRRQYHWFMDMAYSPAVDSQQQDGIGNRIGNRVPPEHTVPYKFLNSLYNTSAPGHYVMAEDNTIAYSYNGKVVSAYSPEEELTDVVSAIKTPWKDSKSALKRGKERFEIYCSPCHGIGGKGDGTVAEKWEGAIPAIARKTPGAALANGIEDWSEARYFMGITLGIRTMPAYASQIPEKDRWAIAKYVKQIQKEARK